MKLDKKLQLIDMVMWYYYLSNVYNASAATSHVSSFPTNFNTTPQPWLFHISWPWIKLALDWDNYQHNLVGRSRGSRYNVKCGRACVTQITIWGIERPLVSRIRMRRNNHSILHMELIINQLVKNGEATLLSIYRLISNKKMHVLYAQRCDPKSWRWVK